ncbi:MAG: hypothetical protein ACM3ON_01080, partial [Chloroflexota bacterium]
MGRSVYQVFVMCVAMVLAAGLFCAKADAEYKKGAARKAGAKKVTETPVDVKVCYGCHEPIK